MNFFEHQDEARSSTRKLVVLFACAILTLAVVASLLVFALLFYAESGGVESLSIDVVYSDIFIQVCLGVLAVVGLGSLFRLAQLRGGGRVVAESMGGRLLNTSHGDADAKKVLNVVEEMAIAAGLPVPPVYLIDDPAINAFAAGYHQKDAVIGVTRGCIQQLSRDELQGVIAHEFSHIFHGDMRLNIRLMGVLYGIMVLGLIGYFLMRGSVFTSRRNRNGGIIFLGLGLVVIGYGGTFFGNLIKAAVSRQREFLADASAVQFTRNPEGISGALKKIGGFKAGSKITSVDVSEISHMLFEEGQNVGFSGMMATHPPLSERIKRIDPRWKGVSVESTEHSNSSSGASSELASGFADSVVQSVGNPQAHHVEFAHSLLASIPALVMEAVHEPFSARALVHALVIFSNDSETREKQVNYLKSEFTQAEFRQFAGVVNEVSNLTREQYLPLIELSIPSLKQLSPEQYKTFMARLSQLIIADEEVSLFEWSLFTILRHNLEGVDSSPSGRVDISVLNNECEVLLSALAQAGHETIAAAQQAFSEGVSALQINQELSLKQRDVDIKVLDAALSKLNKLKPLQKPRLLKAMIVCIEADGELSPKEGELLRAVASLLDCPIPPLMISRP